MKESKYIPDKSCVFHEPFLNWSDVSSNGGTGVNSPTITNGECTFNGTTNYVINSKHPFSFSNVTIRIRCYPTAFTNVIHYIVGLTIPQVASPTVNGVYINYTTASNKWGLLINGSSYPATTSYTTLNTYVELTITISGTSIKFYLNGNADGTGTLPSNSGNYVTTLYLGSRSTVANIGFIGKLDIVTIYNRVLSPDEVLLLYKNSICKVPTSITEVLNINNTIGIISDKFSNSITNTNTTLCKIGDSYAMKFNGSTSKLSVNTIATVSMLNSTVGTLMCWIYLNTISATPQIIDFGDTDADTRIQFDVYNTGYLRALVGIAGTTYWATDTDAAVIGINKWIHVGLVQNGISPVLYVNGVAVAQAFSTSTDKTKWFSQMSGLDNCRLGCGNWNGTGDTNFLNGMISQPIVIKEAVSSSYIAQVYNSQKSKYGL